MNSFNLRAVSPIDGRYYAQTEVLTNYFSEYGLIRNRYQIELKYLLALDKLSLKGFKPFTEMQRKQLLDLINGFSETDAQAIKSIEQTTNHDVKAVEYYLKQQFETLQMQEWTEFIHFGLTSQDINNTAVPLAIKECDNQVLLPKLQPLIQQLKLMAQQWKNIPMLARTHGQAASPTLLEIGRAHV